MTEEEKENILKKYEKEVKKDIASGMPLTEIIEKYQKKVKDEIYPKEFIAVVRIDAPKFANERVTAAMIERRFPTSKVLAIAEIDSKIAVEVILHHIGESNECEYFKIETDKIQ
jgi:hypothetical protein